MNTIGALGRQQNGLWQVLLGKLRGSAAPQDDQTSFFAPDFALETPTPWLVAESTAELTSTQLKEFIKNEHFELSAKVEPDAEEFSLRHGQILERIARGEFQKVVPVVFSQMQWRGSLSALMSRLLNVPEKLWPYGFSLEDDGMVGVTPEILFQKKGLLVETQAVAGTAAFNGPNLLENQKERHEHELVVEDLVQELSPLGEVVVEATAERPAGPLKHLLTPLRIQLKTDVSFEQLAGLLHPSAALGGFPRGPTRRWLQEQPEAKIRRRFGAPFGWRLANGDGTCLVAIRNLQWHKEKVWVGSGCGVVQGSVAEQEWQELRMKRAVILQTLGVNV